MYYYRKDLPYLLRKHVGETFYSIAHGECVLKSINIDDESSVMFFSMRSNDNISFLIFPDLKMTPDGQPVLWPSEKLYQKYPNDPDLAWEEWEAWYKPQDESEPKTYTEVAERLFEKGSYQEDKTHGVVFMSGVNPTYPFNYCTPQQLIKIRAINKLMNVRNYLEGVWRPDYSKREKSFHLFMKYVDGVPVVSVDCFQTKTYLSIPFSSEENALKALDILGQETVLEALNYM